MWNNTELKPVGLSRNKKKNSVEFIVVKDHLTPLLQSRAS